MQKIKSDISVAESYTDSISVAAEGILDAGVVISEDGTTTLSVNSNSTRLNNTITKALRSLSAQINADCERIFSIAEAFEEKDQTIARGGILNGGR